MSIRACWKFLKIQGYVYLYSVKVIEVQGHFDVFLTGQWLNVNAPGEIYLFLFEFKIRYFYYKI